tara:strand:- start:1554 stop:1856 length:303 start_codon:yes stop_codon:yes gene_type:complete
MIMLARMDEDRTFSLNIFFKMKINNFMDRNEQIIRVLDDHSIESLIKKQLPSKPQVFVLRKKIAEIHEQKILGGLYGRLQIMQFRITLKVETVVNYGDFK